MAQQTDLQRELATLIAMVDELDRFLDGARPYRAVSVQLPTGGRSPATMSLGVLLELDAELRARQAELTDSDRASLRDAEERIVEVRGTRPGAYASALQRELKSQLDTWRWYLDDCARGERDRVADYRFEAGVRTRIATLTAAARACDADVAPLLEDTTSLDDGLKRVLAEGPYGGPEGQADRYPKHVYWWLYGRPKRDD